VTRPELHSTYEVTAEDMARENRMTELLDHFHKTKDLPQKQQLFTEYTELHFQRSPAFVRHMEIIKGLVQ
jgi:hypothetical protein